MHQPRALNVMAIALQTSCTTRPVHLKEEIQMVCLWIQDIVSKDFNQVTHRTLYPGQQFNRYSNTYRQHGTEHRYIVARLLSTQFLQAAQQIGIGLNDMQMGILRLGIVGIQFRQAHISNLPHSLVQASI